MSFMLAHAPLLPAPAIHLAASKGSLDYGHLRKAFPAQVWLRQTTGGVSGMDWGPPPSLGVF